MSDNFYDYKAALNTLYNGVVVERGPVIDVNSLYPVAISQSEIDNITVIIAGNRAFEESCEAHFTALDRSPMDPWNVAECVAREAELRVKADLIERDRLAAEPVKQLKKSSNLGCWVDGKLRFQSRDHDAVRSYAEKEMNNKRNGSVWLAPVGSFIDDKTFAEKYPDHG